jgi:hypothetical protein
MFTDRPWSNHANLISDGDTLYGGPREYFEHVSRGLIQLITYVIVQMPPKYRARLSRDRALSCLSVVIDGERVVASPWKEGPGWAEEECRAGPAPPHEENATQKRLYELQASDNPAKQKYPFGNELIDGSHREDFGKLVLGAEASIPICNLSRPQGGSEPSIAGSRNCESHFFKPGNRFTYVSISFISESEIRHGWNA